MNTIYEEFLSKLISLDKKNQATVVFLHGDLGSGKTTFVKNLCKYLNLSVDIHSPTFVILKAYQVDILDFKRIIHIDAYRLESFEDLKKIKIEEYIKDRENLIFIEWPNIVKNSLLESNIEIFFEHVFETGDHSIKIA